MRVKERLIDYVQYETTSHEASETVPSTTCQLELAKHLVEEMKTLGITDAFMDEYGYVYGSVAGNCEGAPTIGLIAHMDTSEAASGKNVRPRVIENYDGKDIPLNENLTTEVSRFPELLNYVGKTLIVTDGNTLLGGDDKAGIAIILETVDYLRSHPEIPHGMIMIGFNPDEEIGRGADLYNLDVFKCDYAYTIDGSTPNEMEFENFNAASATVTVTGISTHPGSAKDAMINPINVAMEFHANLPVNQRPEYTSGYEGFNHLTDIEGNPETCVMHYILRDHDFEKLQQKKQLFKDIETFMNKKYPANTVKVELKDAYRNMKEKFEGHTEPLDLVRKAMKELDMNCTPVAIRGGTDGAQLTWKGVLCPNLGTGAHNLHGRHEYVVVEEMEQMVCLLLKMLTLACEK